MRGVTRAVAVHATNPGPPRMRQSSTLDSVQPPSLTAACSLECESDDMPQLRHFTLTRGYGDAPGESLQAVRSESCRRSELEKV